MAIYKDNKRNTWYFRIYVTDRTGKRVQKTRSGFKTKSECKDSENRFLLNYTDKNDNILFIDLYNVYIKNKEQSLKYQSFKTLKNRIENHIIPFFKNYRLNNIKASDIIEWKNYIINKNYSYTYNSSLYKVLVNIFNFATAFYDLDYNIVKKIGNFSRGNYCSNINFWSLDEYNNFISKVDDIVYYTLFDLLYYTGLRLGEALALNWKDLQNNYINVTKTLLKSSIDIPMFNAPKTQASIRKIKIDNNVLENLNRLHSYYKNFIDFNDNWFIFGGIKPLSRTTIERKKNYYCSISKVKQIRMHDFRHSHASFLLSKGVPITVISKRLGHSNIAMTLNIYSHLMLDDEDKAVDLLNKLKS